MTDPKAYSALEILRAYLGCTNVYTDLDVVVEVILSIEGLRVGKARADLLAESI